MEPIFFKSQAEWRKWLERNHDHSTGIVVGFYRVGSRKGGLTYPESLDEALCFGWIDGLRKGIDEDSYTIRYSPRKVRSIWSKVNIRKIKELTDAGKMHEAGLKVFQNRDKKLSNIYSFEQKNVPELSMAFVKRFKSNKPAWKFFESQAPWYKRSAAHWVMSAKQEATRLKRFKDLINDSEKEMKAKPFRYGQK